MTTFASVTGCTLLLCTVFATESRAAYISATAHETISAYETLTVSFSADTSTRAGTFSLSDFVVVPQRFDYITQGVKSTAATLDSFSIAYDGPHQIDAVFSLSDPFADYYFTEAALVEQWFAPAAFTFELTADLTTGAITMSVGTTGDGLSLVGSVTSIQASGFASPVPLPGSAPLFAAALIGLGAVGHGLKRRRAVAG